MSPYVKEIRELLSLDACNSLPWWFLGKKNAFNFCPIYLGIKGLPTLPNASYSNGYWSVTGKYTIESNVQTQT